MRTLTRRGRGLVTSGLIGVGVGWGIGQVSVTIVATLLLLLPTVGVLLVRSSRFVLGSTRTVGPARIAFGDEAEVVLTVENGSRFTSGVLLLEDDVPPSLGEPVRLLLDRIPPRAQRSRRYRITGRQRGRARIGPLKVTVADPFGTAAMSRSFADTNPVMVTPEIVALGTGAASMTPGGDGESLFRSLAARGDDDLLPREHRAGDDMRRIHWRATARQGELMVRREEQAWHSSVLVVLDDRADAHEGSGPTSTFEWAVSAAASLAVHYLRRGWRVTAVTMTGRVLAEASGGFGADIDGVLQAFADVRASPGPIASTVLAGGEGPTASIAVIGLLTDDAAWAISRPSSGFAGCLLLDLGPAGRLRSQGWQVSSWSPGTPVAEAWARIAPVRAAAR